MKSNSRLKVYLAFLLTLLSIYLLLPTILGFKEIRDDAEAKNQALPWYVSLFPQKEINLGLDLRGGIYLELEVEMKEALVRRSEINASEIERFLKDEKIAYSEVRVLPKTSHLSIVVKDAKGLQAVKKHLADYYRDSMLDAPASPLLSFEWTGQAEVIEGQFQEILQWAKSQPDILDTSRRDAKLELVLATTADREKVQSALMAQFPNELKPVATDPLALYLMQSERYQQNLKDETLKQAVETIRNRIDRHGVTEPSIQTLGGDRVVVELPGEKDPERAIALVKRAGNLEFKIVDDTVPASQLEQLIATARNDAKIAPGFDVDKVNQINEALKGKIPVESEIAFELNYDLVSKKVVGGTPYLLKKKVTVSGDMLSDVRVGVHENEPEVNLSFNPAGAQAFGELTKNNVGKRLAILLDGNVSKAPVINDAIMSGEARITLGNGDYDAQLKEAEDLKLVLKEGALPARLKEATKTVIGPSLGALSIKKGFNAMMVAAAIVIIFMALWYKGAGIVADLAVILNVLFIFAGLTLFGATLTLPGVAGIVLTIGMAVDANVIILERIKEELADGRSVKAAVDLGYSNAMRAVLDANITTFLSGVVLYYFGTGPVKGFAVTLMVGIVTTLYTAVILTRMYYESKLSKKNVTSLSL